MQGFLTTRQAALRLGVAYGTMMGWIYKSKLRATRHGWCWYVHETDVAEKLVEIEARRPRLAA